MISLNQDSRETVQRFINEAYAEFDATLASIMAAGVPMCNIVVMQMPTLQAERHYAHVVWAIWIRPDQGWAEAEAQAETRT